MQLFDIFIIFCSLKSISATYKFLNIFIRSNFSIIILIPSSNNIFSIFFLFLANKKQKYTQHLLIFIFSKINPSFWLFSIIVFLNYKAIYFGKKKISNINIIILFFINISKNIIFIYSSFSKIFSLNIISYYFNILCS